jgi:hypothetical protein
LILLFELTIAFYLSITYVKKLNANGSRSIVMSVKL